MITDIYPLFGILVIVLYEKDFLKRVFNGLGIAGGRVMDGKSFGYMFYIGLRGVLSLPIFTID